MSDGGHHEAITAAAWFAPVLAVGSSIMTAFLLFLAQRLVGKAAWQAAVTAANKDMIDQLQEERKDYRIERAALLEERAAERLGWAAERSQYRGDLTNLTQAFESLKAYLRREGIQVPESAYHHLPDEFVMIEGTKK